MNNSDLEVFGFTVVQGGRRVVIPPAIEHWKKSIVAIDILWMGKVEKYNPYELLQSNLTIILLTTGFENYCKVRCYELEKAGITLNLDEIFEICNIDTDVEKEKINAKATTNKITIIQQLITENRLSFQSYKNCTRIYYKGCGVKFDELPSISSLDIKCIKDNINYRHRLIHVDPLISMVNELNVPEEKPIFASKKYADEVKQVFDKFIHALHSKTEDMMIKK